MKLDENISERIEKLVKELRQFNHADAAMMLAKLHDHAVRTQDYIEVKNSRDSWHEAWYSQREAIGKAAWDTPILLYIKNARIDPRNFMYFAKIDKMLWGFLRVIEMAVGITEEKKKPNDAVSVAQKQLKQEKHPMEALIGKRQDDIGVEDIIAKFNAISSSVMKAQSWEYEHSCLTLARVIKLPQSNTRDATIKYLWKKIHYGIVIADKFNVQSEHEQKPVILFCDKHKIHYDRRNGCRSCPSVIDQLKLENDALNKRLRAQEGHTCLVLGKCSGQCNAARRS